MAGSWPPDARSAQAVVGGITVNELIVDFWHHADRYYRKNGEHTGEIQALRYSLRPLSNLYGEEPVADFGPRKLKSVRHKMIGQGLARSLINKRINRIRHVFKWGVENELVEPALLDGLRSVSPLKRGRSEAREAPPVKPVPERLVAGVEKYVSRQIWAMIQLQLRTAMRPGEVVSMRQGELDTSGRVWIYCPESYKTQHHGTPRHVYLGPEAQAIVKPFLNRMPHRYLFSPDEAEQARNKWRHENRSTPMSCGNTPGKNRQKNRRRAPRDHYDVGSYRRAIARACDRAYPWPGLEGRRTQDLTESEKAMRKQWQKKHRWHPHQLRHNAATLLRREFGIEAARLILGHRSIAVTELYAELDQAKAADIMGKVG